MTAVAEPTRRSARPASARRTPASSPAGPATPTRSRRPARCTCTSSRSPIAHAHDHRRSTPPRPTQAPGVFGVYTAADLGVEAVGLPCAWPITPDMKSPQRPLLAGRTVHFAGEGVAVVVARSAAEAQRRRRARRGRLRRRSSPCSTWRRPSPTAPPSCTRTWAPTRTPPGCSTPARPAPAAASTRPSPRPRPTPTRIVVRRRFRQQRLIPAFMEPRSCVVDPTGEQITMWSATQVPHILRDDDRA